MPQLVTIETRPRAMAAFSHVGSVRSRNEDAIAMDGEQVADGQLLTMILPPGPHRLVLADGLGGHARGDVASLLVAKRLSEASLDCLESCLEAIRSVNQALYSEMQRDPSLLGMGSTVAGAVVLDDHIYWFNVGDSRIYLFRNNVLRLISVDHIPVWDTMEERGRSHLLTQCLGGGYSAVEVTPAIGRADFNADDTLLLCSDGLTDVVDDTIIARVLGDRPTTSAAARILVERALHEGGPDNVSVLIVGPNQGSASR
jgi:protein phosphatase